jgi:hypothetical protein
MKSLKYNLNLILFFITMAKNNLREQKTKLTEAPLGNRIKRLPKSKKIRHVQFKTALIANQR